MSFLSSTLKANVFWLDEKTLQKMFSILLAEHECSSNKFWSAQKNAHAQSAAGIGRTPNNGVGKNANAKELLLEGKYVWSYCPAVFLIDTNRKNYMSKLTAEI